ncbi:MAG: VWA domain-containing protein [Pseudomonadota bacterium]|nr:VWA domain-containing protein [Pseudomonadota bacterium]
MARKRDTESFGLSYLDVMCCGFGAIILLLMITRVSESRTEALEQAEMPLSGNVLELQRQLFSIRGETNLLNRDLNAKHEQLSQYEDRVARLRRELSSLEARFSSTNDRSTDFDQMQGQLALARQALTEEMKRLQESMSAQMATESVGGVPVDSEYVIFIIDTSGSMFNYAWDRMIEVMDETLDIYPELKGIQVMNDEGDYMFSSFRSDWIPDTPTRRQQIMQRLRTWNPFSNSSPVEGIVTAIRTFYEPGRKISLYVLGDDFTGNSISDVVETVDRINVADESGERLVRIHGIGFPVVLSQPERYRMGGFRFSALMRELARKNGGTFVGLNDFY